METESQEISEYQKEIIKLRRKVLELEAGVLSALHFANQSIDKASTKYMMASGVLIQMTALGGREIINPIIIRDGLSDETIAALKKDFKRSADLITMFEIK